MKHFVYALAAWLATIGAAYAQSSFPTPTGPATVGVVEMCLNASGQAIPLGPSCVTPGSSNGALVVAAPTTPSAGVFAPLQLDLTGRLQGTLLPSLTGSYSMTATSGTMAAGLAASSPIVSWRYGGTGIALVRRIYLTAYDVTTGFAAGTATFNLFAARSFSASDTGGTAVTFSGNNGKLRTSYATTGVADFRTSSTATLTAGTRTLDATAVHTLNVNVPTTSGFQLLNMDQLLFDAVSPSQPPLQLANNEGFVIQATVPATGTWVFSVTVIWDEAAAF